MSGERLFVYAHSAGGKIFYVGMGNAKRPFAYGRSSRTSRWCEHVKSVGTYNTNILAQTNDRIEAQKIEARLIAIHTPVCNVRKNETRLVWEKSDRTDLMRFCVKPATKAAIKKAAADDSRPPSVFAVKLVEDWLKERGYLK
jgi:hypothetical protein